MKLTITHLCRIIKEELSAVKKGSKLKEAIDPVRLEIAVKDTMTKYMQAMLIENPGENLVDIMTSLAEGVYEDVMSHEHEDGSASTPVRYGNRSNR